ncbi:unnamed protein product [Parnassius mnemosyne]|uniref:V-type proton ATPase subunit D n=1 Tax=Parnassius mnemosyne TaxID=213953 RepID=A0AAV1LDI1_9NEOP
MFKDENEDEENTFGVTRYPCMPSLVALQQMKNRLHLANLGKKLMKWTALATGSELRHFTTQLESVYRSFSEDMRNAYMLLARCRYFYPNLNKMVTEGVPTTAYISLFSTTKIAPGVKIKKYEIVKDDKHPYEHLGLEKGGQAIQEAKQAWTELLKRMILMVELRTNFKLVEEVYKAANKKANVLGKLVVPKIKVTCAYIINALEELARDEFYRRKIILDVKRRRTKKENTVKHVPKEDEYCAVCGEVLDKDFLNEIELIRSSTHHDKIKKNRQLADLKEHISEILGVINSVDKNSFQVPNIKEFLNLAQELQNKLDERLNSEPVSSQSDRKMCENCLSKLANEQDKKNIQEEILNSEIIENVHESRSILTLEDSTEKIFKKLEPCCKKRQSIDIMETDLRLGAFEIDVKEITKIFRSKNKDGTIREEKRTIKIKKEIRDSTTQDLIPLSSSNNSVNSKDIENFNITYDDLPGPSSKISQSHNKNSGILND